MKIAHFALWTQQLEAQARFWVEFFAASINEKSGLSLKLLGPQSEMGNFHGKPPGRNIDNHSRADDHGKSALVAVGEKQHNRANQLLK
jgi:hypothetical protein